MLIRLFLVLSFLTFNVFADEVDFSKVDCNSVETRKALIEEYNEIKFPEEFSLEVRHARLKSSTLDPVPESEKSEKFKAIEKLENEIDMDIFNNLIQPRSAGYHSCNNTTSILTTMNGNKLYPSERCVWFEGGDRIMMFYLQSC